MLLFVTVCIHSTTCGSHYAIDIDSFFRCHRYLVNQVKSRFSCASATSDARVRAAGSLRGPARAARPCCAIVPPLKQGARVYSRPAHRNPRGFHRGLPGLGEGGRGGSKRRNAPAYWTGTPNPPVAKPAAREMKRKKKRPNRPTHRGNAKKSHTGSEFRSGHETKITDPSGSLTVPALLRLGTGRAACRRPLEETTIDFRTTSERSESGSIVKQETRT